MAKLLVIFFKALNRLLHQPGKVFLMCLTIAFVSLILEGSLFHLWSLHRDGQGIKNKIESLKSENIKLSMKIDKVLDPTFLELEARNQFDLVNQGDLVFVFSERE